MPGCPNSLEVDQSLFRENVIIFRFSAPYIIYVECIDVTDVSTSPLVPKSLGASINLNHVQSMQQMNGHHSSPLRHVKSEERLNDAASNRYVPLWNSTSNSVEISGFFLSLRSYVKSTLKSLEVP